MTSKRIKQLRKSRKLSQEDMAKILGVDKITVSRWERGESKPSLLALKQLARLERRK